MMLLFLKWREISFCPFVLLQTEQRGNSSKKTAYFDYVCCFAKQINNTNLILMNFKSVHDINYVDFMLC